VYTGLQDSMCIRYDQCHPG